MTPPDAYLEQVRRAMSGMEPGVRDDILRELRSHIAESTAANGGNVNASLAAVGSAEEVGRHYRELYGYGRAYKTGFHEARGTYIAALDADLTYPADRLSDFLAALETDRADFVSGDRMSHLGGEAMSGMHRIGNAILNAAFRLLYRARIRDSQSGMWAFRRSILPRLYLVHDGMAFSEELKIEAIRNGFRFFEIPVDYRVRVGDKKIRSTSDAVKNLIWLARKRFGWHPKPR